jgi:hypothetical protein
MARAPSPAREARALPRGKGLVVSNLQPQSVLIDGHEVVGRDPTPSPLDQMPVWPKLHE